MEAEAEARDEARLDREREVPPRRPFVGISQSLIVAEIGLERETPSLVKIEFN